MSILMVVRPAQPADIDFLWAVQQAALQPYGQPLPGGQREQRARFERRLDLRTHHVVRVDGADAGFLCYERRADHLWLSVIALLPRFQSQGVGSMLLRRVITEADSDGLEVRLQVQRTNPRAKDLYRRLGFSIAHHTPTHVIMTRDRV